MLENKFVHDHGDGNFHTHANGKDNGNPLGHEHEIVSGNEPGIEPGIEPGNGQGQEAGHQHGHEHTHTQTKKVINRLSRACGHLEAVKRMVEDGRDCSEVLIQLAAVRAALNSTANIILKDHIDHCIVDAAGSGDMETIEKLNEAIDMLMK